MESLNMKAHRAIWVTFLVGLIAHTGLGVTLAGSLETPPEILRTIAISQTVIAVLCAGGSFLLWRKRNSRGNTTQQVHTYSCLTWGLDELVGLLGLVLALSGAALAGWLPFALAGLALLFIHRPKDSDAAP